MEVQRHTMSIMLLKSILHLSFLGFIVQFSISEQINGNDSIHFLATVRKESNQQFVLVNPRQVQPLVSTIYRFLSKMGVLVKRPIILRSKEKDIQLTIREICDSVRKSFMHFANDCGLKTTVRHYEQGLSSVPLCEDWYSEMLLQGSYLLHDLGNMINEIENRIDAYVGEHKVTSQGIKQLTRQSDSFQFLGMVYDVADFGDRLSQCLLQMSTSEYERFSNFNQALLNLTRHPPAIVLEILKSNLNTTWLDDPLKHQGRRDSWCVTLCLAIAKDEEVRYRDCMRDLYHLERCLHRLKQGSQSKGKVFEEKSWTKAIQRLSDCTVRLDKQGKASVFCKTSRGTPRMIKQKMKYIFERILNKKISKRSPLHRAAYDLGDTLFGSKLGQRFVDELYQYCSIYDDGMRKLQRLSAFKAKDKAAVARYKEVSKALFVYKKGVFTRTFDALGKIHHSATEFTKLLVNGIKITLNETWQSHVSILSSMIEWMFKLLEFYVAGNGEDGQTSSDTNMAVEESNEDEDSTMEDSSGRDCLETTVIRSKTKLMKEADASMNDLMQSMNRMSRHRSVNNESMLACLANNFLLATMFMEIMGFVSTLFSFGQTTNSGQNFIEFDNE